MLKNEMKTKCLNHEFIAALIIVLVIEARSSSIMYESCDLLR